MLNEPQWEALGKQIPLGAAASPSEIAGPILFLASDLASHVTGQTLLVDGGIARTVHLQALVTIGESFWCGEGGQDAFKSIVHPIW